MSNTEWYHRQRLLFLAVFFSFSFVFSLLVCFVLIFLVVEYISNVPL